MFLKSISRTAAFVAFASLSVTSCGGSGSSSTSDTAGNGADAAAAEINDNATASDDPGSNDTVPAGRYDRVDLPAETLKDGESRLIEGSGLLADVSAAPRATASTPSITISLQDVFGPSPSASWDATGIVDGTERKTRVTETAPDGLDLVAYELVVNASDAELATLAATLDGNVVDLTQRGVMSGMGLVASGKGPWILEVTRSGAPFASIDLVNKTVTLAAADAGGTEVKLGSTLSASVPIMSNGAGYPAAIFEANVPLDAAIIAGTPTEFHRPDFGSLTAASVWGDGVAAPTADPSKKYVTVLVDGFETTPPDNDGPLACGLDTREFLLGNSLTLDGTKALNADYVSSITRTYGTPASLDPEYLQLVFEVPADFKSGTLAMHWVGQYAGRNCNGQAIEGDTSTAAAAAITFP